MNDVFYFLFGTPRIKPTQPFLNTLVNPDPTAGYLMVI